MNNETCQISDIMPVDADLFGGEISLEGDFSFTSTQNSKTGDLIYSGFEMVSDFGRATGSMMGIHHYFAISETYRYKQGLTVTTRLNQPMIELHFQLEGSAHAQTIQSQAIQSSTDLDLDIKSGETNLMIVPPLSDTFELKEEMGGNIFSILLSIEYIKDLSNRYPELMEPILTKVNRKEFCLLKEQNLHITPRMRDVIQRIQNQSYGQIAGSLFLEAQILDLLSQFFTNPEQPVSANGHSLSRSDLDHIHRAREILLERLEAPPTLAELSRFVGTNEFKLKRGFKEVFGTSPYAYHLQYKLERAKSYILDTDLTIAEIAYQVGYSDPSHLTNAFRKQYGIRPSDLR